MPVALLLSYWMTALRYADLLQKHEQAPLWEAHANECHLTNDVSRGIQSAQRARGLWQALGNIPAQARMLLLLGNQFWKAGDRVLADQHVEDATALLETLPPSRDQAIQ